MVWRMEEDERDRMAVEGRREVEARRGSIILF